MIEHSSLAPSIIAEVNSGNVLLYEKSASRRMLGSGSGFRLEPASGRLLTVDGRPYRGSLELFINPLGVPVLVNELNLEDYIRGVVPNELGPRRFPWEEALKVQAVASRTYAVYHLNSGSVRGYDAFADHRSQVYRGAASEDPLSDAAVLNTRGIIMTYEQSPILALYSSTCGGETGQYAEIFGRTGIPYLEGGVDCPDTSSPYHSWEETIPMSKIRSRLDTYRIGRLREIEPLERGPSGRLIEARLKGDRGSKVLQGNHLRFALGLKSNLVLEIRPVRDRDGYVQELRVKGRGWGHGVGLCQIGAVEMAQQGLDYRRILETYYKGVRLLKAYP